MFDEHVFGKTEKLWLNGLIKTIENGVFKSF
jgi:hypothetical protein